jgi:hypothetical protein
MSDYFLNKIYESLLSNKPVPKKPEPIVEKKETFKSLSNAYTSLYEQDLQGQLFTTVKGKQGPREEPIFKAPGEVYAGKEKHLWKEPDQPDDFERQRAIFELSKEHKNTIRNIALKGNVSDKLVDEIHSALMSNSSITADIINKCLYKIEQNYIDNKPTTNFNIKTGNISDLFLKDDNLASFWLAIKDIGRQIKQAGPGEWGFVFMCPKILSATKGDISVSQDDGALLLNRDNIVYELKLDDGRITAAPTPSRFKILRILEKHQLLPKETKGLSKYDFLKLLLTKPLEQRILITKDIFTIIFDNIEAGKQISSVWEKTTESNPENIIQQLLLEFAKISFAQYQQVEGDFNKLLAINTKTKHAVVVDNENEFVQFLSSNVLKNIPSQYDKVLISSDSGVREYWLKVNPV